MYVEQTESLWVNTSPSRHYPGPQIYSTEKETVFALRRSGSEKKGVPDRSTLLGLIRSRSLACFLACF